MMTVNINIGGNENVKTTTRSNEFALNGPPAPNLMEAENIDSGEAESSGAPTPETLMEEADGSNAGNVPSPEGFENTQKLGHGLAPSPEEMDMTSHDHASGGGIPEPEGMAEDKPKTTKKSTKSATSRSTAKKK